MHNKEVHEWFCSLKDKSVSNVCRLFQLNFIDSECDDLSLFTKISCVVEKTKTLHKKEKQKHEFLSKEFLPPGRESNFERAGASAMTDKEKKLIVKLEAVKLENKGLKRKASQVGLFELSAFQFLLSMN